MNTKEGLGRPSKNTRPKDPPAKSVTEAMEITDAPDSGNVEIGHDAKLQRNAFVKRTKKDGELATRILQSKIPVRVPSNNLQPTLPINDEAASVRSDVQQEVPIDDEAASVTSSVQQELNKLPLKEERVNVRRNLQKELEQEAVDCGCKSEDSIESDAVEVEEESNIGAVALAVVDFPKNIQNWGKIPKEEVKEMEKIAMRSKQSGQVAEVLEKFQDLTNLSESDNRFYCNAQYALKDSYLKPSPFFAYQDGLKDTHYAARGPSSVTMENMTAEENDCMQRVEFYKDTKKGYSTLANMPQINHMPKSPPLPPLEVIKEHSRLLEQQIKEMVELLHAQGKISEKLGETIISISEEKKMTEETKNFLEGNEESARFITENGIDALLKNYTE